jgi:hypothetical protein
MLEWHSDLELNFHPILPTQTVFNFKHSRELLGLAKIPPNHTMANR